MRVKTRTIPFFVAYDGREFDTAEECLKYEMGTVAGIRCGLHTIGRNKQVLKSGITLAERNVKCYRNGVMNLLGVKRATRSHEVCKRLSELFAAIAKNLETRDAFVSDLREARARQRLLRSALDNPADNGEDK